ncbi:trypsin-like peptidase domain-containing protein [Bradyrhizobium sp. S3.2.12]|uniref:trypsin-like peptidase domain-containing protein n=1 Tax=Bradyrhizobium sp. S3.2.12 TaxID=3156387 RepID=UPI00339718BA
MIPTDLAQVLDAEVFAAALARAMNSVVSIQILGRGLGQQFMCTGWMVTPNIVMIPEHVADQSALGPEAISPVWIVRGMSDGRVQWQDRSGTLFRLRPDASPKVERGFRISLLVLRRSYKRAQLELSLATPVPGAFISVLSFPLGRPRLALSLGRLISYDEISLGYDAATEPGSSGAPVVDDKLQVIGMHTTAGRSANHGVSRSAMLEMLQQMPPWPEIANFHKIAELTANPTQVSVTSAGTDSSPEKTFLIRAALRVNIKRGTMTEAQRDILRPNVVDPKAKSWTLRPHVRQTLIRSVGSLEALRPYAPRDRKTPGQRVISQILAGPPYDLTKNTEEELSWWVQASRWFTGVAPDLPGPAEANRLLQKRRVRSRLASIAGEDFAGRTIELQAIGKWYEREPSVPLCIFGVGGVGKSALVASFAASLPDETLLLWLDFDRADLAPDDAVSVISGLIEQAQVQLEDIVAPSVDDSDWKASARALALALKAYNPARPLLVLDSFEVAQYAERYQELWPVLEEISSSLPSLRVIVSGRAPVNALQLHGRSAELLPIKGLKPRDSRDWLRRNGIRSPRVVEDVVKRSRGLPLVLHLARRLVETGGKVGNLPKTLPPEIIAGFLYDRILDRVQHASLKPLAQGALALRRLTPEVIRPVLDGLVELPQGEPADWFRDLSREAALVDGTGVLRLRPEVRTAALELLEREKSSFVRMIDQRAAAWYATQDVNDPEIAAEIVYHRLRLGDVDGATEAWRDGCDLYLQYAEEDLKGKSRNWLRGRLGSSSVAEAPLEAWEHEAAERIRSTHLRGLDRATTEILKERTERSVDSPLVFHEAYAMWQSGRATAALDHLTRSGTSTGPAARERALLRALLLVELEQKPQADAVLRTLCTRETWSDRLQGQRELMAVCAARVRMTVNSKAEHAVLRMARLKEAEIPRVVSPIDVALYQLQEFLVDDLVVTNDRMVSITVSSDYTFNARLEQTLEEFRRQTAPWEPTAFGEIRRMVSLGELPRRDHWPAETPDAVRQVLLGGWRRWEMLYHTPLFEGAVTMLTETRPGPLDLSIAAAYAFFCGLHGLNVMLLDAHGPDPASLDDLTFRVLTRDLSKLSSRQMRDLIEEVPPHQRTGDFSDRSRIRMLAMSLLEATPDPLRLLVDRFAGKERADV